MKNNNPKWRLKCGLLYAGTGKNLKADLVEKDSALVFDNRDNPAIRQEFYKAVTGYSFEIELCES